MKGQKKIEDENTNECKICTRKKRIDKMIKTTKIKEVKIVVSWLLKCTFLFTK